MQTVVIYDEEEELSSLFQFTVTSETVEEITIEDDSGEQEESVLKQKEKLKSLKRKLMPSRKSPRVKIP